MSMNPGATTCPRASITWRAWAAPSSLPTASIVPAAIPISPGNHGLPVPSAIRALVTSVSNTQANLNLELAGLLISDDLVKGGLPGCMRRVDPLLAGQGRRHRRLDRVRDLLIGRTGFVPITLVVLLLEGGIDDLLVRAGERAVG